MPRAVRRRDVFLESKLEHPVGRLAAEALHVLGGKSAELTGLSSGKPAKVSTWLCEHASFQDFHRTLWSSQSISRARASSSCRRLAVRRLSRIVETQTPPKDFARAVRPVDALPSFPPESADAWSARTGTESHSLDMFFQLSQRNPNKERGAGGRVSLEDHAL